MGAYIDVRDQEKRTCDIPNTVRNPSKKAEMRARQGARGFVAGSVQIVHDQNKTQARRSIATHICFF